jgi:hypothetical protein
MASAVAPESACSTLDLSAPSGEPVDLTGTWETEVWTPRAGTYYLQQIGHCLWWAGGFPLTREDPTFGPTGNWINVFRGAIGSDFTVAGDWTDVHRDCVLVTVFECHGGPSRPGTGGAITLRIEFEGDAVRLVFVGGTGELFNGDLTGLDQSWVSVDGDQALPAP